MSTAIHPAFIGKSDILAQTAQLAGIELIESQPVARTSSADLIGIPYLAPYVPAYKASAKSARYSVSATVKASEK